MTRKIKIAFCLWDWFAGGILTQTLNLCRELAKTNKYEFYYLASKVEAFHPCIKSIGETIFTGLNRNNIITRLKEINPDIVQVACDPSYISACKEVGITNIVERVDGFRSMHRIHKIHVKKAVCHSFGILRQLQKDYAGLKERFYYIANGVPIQKNPVKHFDKKKLTFGRLSRFGFGKNLQMMLDLAEIFPQHNFLIVGDNSRIPGQKDIKGYLDDILKTKNLKNAFIIPAVESDEEKEKMIKSFDVAMCTSMPANEGISNFLIEAMSYGLPIITTPVGEHGELFQYGSPGILIKDFSLDQAVMAVRKIEDFKFRELSSRVALDLINKYWDSTVMAKKYETVYSEVIK